MRATIVTVGPNPGLAVTVKVLAVVAVVWVACWLAERVFARRGRRRGGAR